MILDLVTYPDVRLTTPATKLTQADINGHQIQTLIEDMMDTCINQGGVGLAANQVGKTVALFILRYSGNAFEVFINPQIQKVSGRQHCKGEGCLSVPEKRFNVKRYKQVELKYLDRAGEECFLVEKRKKVTQAILHEMDHILGICLANKGKEV